ncbi:hypothetical protein APHAL10511_004865 [Amanita phalloides]|nr:hypothetical protein APHAL10511_004865 [Amanita phalloides]
MPLYRLLCIAAHYPEYQHIKQLVQQSATHVMQAGGVVRALDYLGTSTLPQRMNKHTRGDYWTMHFDTSPRILQSLNRLMRQDPRVIRWSILKLGSKVDEIATEGQKIHMGQPSHADQLLNP